MITSLAGLCASRAFVRLYFARVNFCPLSLPLGVKGWLRHVTVALPGLFLLFFSFALLHYIGLIVLMMSLFECIDEMVDTSAFFFLFFFSVLISTK